MGGMWSERRTSLVQLQTVRNSGTTSNAALTPRPAVLKSGVRSGAAEGKPIGAALNAAEKIEAYRDKRDAAPIKALQGQIALKKALLEDIGLDQAMARADTNSQVQMLQAEIALLTAELTQLKADRDPAAARQP